MDVVASVSGGMRLRDPGADLAVIAALASAATDQPLPRGTAFLGEVALSGAVRPAQQIQRRLSELGRVGFERAFVPPGTANVEGLRLIPVQSVRDALAALNESSHLSATRMQRV
jgi:DNA repair protein RadA/Sms